MNRSVQLVLHGEALLAPATGQAVYTSRLIGGLLRWSDINFRVIVDEAVSGEIGDVPEEVCVFLPRSRLPYPLLRQLARARQAINVATREYPNAIFHSPGPIWCSRRPQKLIVTLHDCIYRQFPRYLGHFPLRRWLAFANERFAATADIVLSVSNYSAHDLTTHAGIPAGKIQVMYNWVGPEFRHDGIPDEQIDAVRKRLKLPKRYWLYVGGYDYRKNVERLIEAYAETAKLTRCPLLVLAGQIPSRRRAPYSDPCGAIRRIGVTDKVVLTGRVTAEDMPALYAGADLFLFPSLYEGFGLPVAEAMAVGTPVLVGDTTSMPELVTRSECRFDPTDVLAMKAKLYSAAEAPSRFRVSMPEQFTEVRAIKRYVELLGSPASGIRA